MVSATSGEPASTEDKFRVDVGQFLGSASARAGGVPEEDDVVLDEADALVGLADGAGGELVDDLHRREPLLLLGDVGEVRVVELPQRLEPVELALQVLVALPFLLEFVLQALGLPAEFRHLAVPTNLDALVTARL